MNCSAGAPLAAAALTVQSAAAMCPRPSSLLLCQPCRHNSQPWPPVCACSWACCWQALRQRACWTQATGWTSSAMVQARPGALQLRPRPLAPRRRRPTHRPASARRHRLQQLPPPHPPFSPLQAWRSGRSRTSAGEGALLRCPSACGAGNVPTLCKGGHRPFSRPPCRAARWTARPSA